MWLTLILLASWRDLVKRHERTLHAQQYEALYGERDAGGTVEVTREQQRRPDPPLALESIEVVLDDSSGDSLGSSEVPSRGVPSHDPRPKRGATETARGGAFGSVNDDYQVDAILDMHFGSLVSVPEATSFQQLQEVEQNFDTSNSTTTEGAFGFNSVPLLNGEYLPAACSQSLDQARNNNFPSSRRASYQVDGDNDVEQARKRPRLDAPPIEGSSSEAIPSEARHESVDVHALSTNFESSDWTDLFNLDDSFPMPIMTFMSPASDSSNACPSGSTPQDAPAAGMSAMPSEQPRKLFSRLPSVLREKADRLPRLELDEVAYRQILEDVADRLSEISAPAPFPSSKDLRRFITSYIDCFHRHFPIVHLASLDFTTVPGPLVLSMACVGALYRLDRKRAHSVYHLAMKLMETVSNPL